MLYGFVVMAWLITPIDGAGKIPFASMAACERAKPVIAAFYAYKQAFNCVPTGASP